jgi:hypothetical protein
MTGPAYTDMIIKVLTGSGVRTDELQGRGVEFIDSIRDGARGEVINFMNTNFGSVAPICFQEIYVPQDQWVQEDECVYKIPCPKPLYNVYGSPYINQIGGSDWNCAGSFRISKFRSEIFRANRHYILGREELTRAFYDTNLSCWWIYRNESVNDFAISQICAQPYQAPQFNVDEDTYPFPTDQNDRLMDAIIQRYFRVLQGVVDTVPNSRNDTQLPQQRR